MAEGIRSACDLLLPTARMLALCLGVPASDVLACRMELELDLGDGGCMSVASLAD